MSDQSSILVGLGVFFLKHFLFDFTFQTKYQLKNKGTYGHPGGLLHAGLHAVGSVPAMLVFQPSQVIIISLCASEFIAHYHIDWLKERIVKKNGWTSADYGYWQALGFDQLVHAATYISLAGVLLVLTAP